MTLNEFVPAGSTASEIAASIERGIRNGGLAPGTALPSVRRLATVLTLSPTTVASAYRILRDRGVVTSRERGRTRVSANPPVAPRVALTIPASTRDLASGNPDPSLLPSIAESANLYRGVRKMYGEPSVLPELRTLAVESLGLPGAAGDDPVVVNGGLDGVERVLGAHLRPGDRVAVEDPCFTGVLDLVRAMNLEPQPMLIDEFGPLPSELERCLSEGVHAVIITPRCQNPTGAALDEQRAGELRAVLDRYPAALVIEDDHAGSTTSLPRHSVVAGRSRWAIVCSVAKSLGPDLRLAVAVGDPTTIGRVEGRQLLGCGWVSHILQAAVVALWASPDVAALLADAAVVYDRRRTALVDALAELGITSVGRSGFNVWIPVDDESAVIMGLLGRGWSVRAGEPYRIHSKPAVRVTTATLDVDDARRFAADFARVTMPQRSTRFA
ncbi:aminotransferase class I/II-fold pyridoxal phosphate-dependent enzyme [Pseudonocardia xishanensis]|uniref:Aminotransferase class I/II-fold pyridoxal phosphate-dependent enzyme n=1 Tax=Pseudonocardia xishanensis TaxID=630995 RepID=A0ABP8RWU3_9PSEU